MQRTFRPGVIVLLTLVAIVVALLLGRLSGAGNAPEPTPSPAAESGTSAVVQPVAAVIPNRAIDATERAAINAGAGMWGAC